MHRWHIVSRVSTIFEWWGRGRTLKPDKVWVIPYSLTLSAKYDDHINVEITASIRWFKYL